MEQQTENVLINSSEKDLYLYIVLNYFSTNEPEREYENEFKRIFVNELHKLFVLWKNIFLESVKMHMKPDWFIKTGLTKYNSLYKLLKRTVISLIIN